MFFLHYGILSSYSSPDVNPGSQFPEDSLVPNNTTYDYWVVGDYSTLLDEDLIPIGPGGQNGIDARRWNAEKNIFYFNQDNASFYPATYEGGLTKGGLQGTMNGEWVDPFPPTVSFSTGALFATSFKLYEQGDNIRLELVSGNTFGFSLTGNPGIEDYDLELNTGVGSTEDIPSIAFRGLLKIGGELNSIVLAKIPDSSFVFLEINGTNIGTFSGNTSGSIDVPVFTSIGNGLGVANTPSNYTKFPHIVKAVAILGDYNATDDNAIKSLDRWLRYE